MLTTKRLTGVSLLVLCVSVLHVNAAGNTVRHRKDSEARQALDQGDLLQANWNEVSLREAAEQFDTAALLWKSLGNFTDASRALLKSGDTYFNRSEYSEAQKRFEEAVSLAAKKEDALDEAKALSRLARLSSYSGNNDVAQQQLIRARALLEKAGPSAEAEGEALTVEGELLQTRGNFKKALTRFDEALASLKDDRNGQARVHLFIGYIQGSIGNTDKAADEISTALDLYRATNNKVGEAQALSALGLVQTAETDHDGAIQLNESARKIFQIVGDRHSEAIANNALGQAYELLKEFQLALKYYSEALRLFESVGAVNGTAPSNCNVARAHFLNNHLDQALSSYHRCLDLSRSAGMTRIEVSALSEMAGVYAKQQRFRLALSQQEKAKKFYESIGDRRGLARALNGYGDLLLQAGKKPQALDAYKQAFSLSEQTGEQETQLMALYKLAQTTLANGDPETALKFIENSLKLIEELRANVASPEFRTSYFSGERQHYDLAIEILCQLEQLHPGHDYAAHALAISEQSRARLLVDLVNESRLKNRGGASNELTEKEIELRGLIRAQAEYQISLGSNPDPAELSEVNAQLAKLRVDYQQVEAQIRQQNPYLSLLEHFEPVSLEQIQKALDPDTMLLEYSLGDERSYMFAVTSDSFRVHELPNRTLIEEPVRKYRELVTVWQGTDGQFTEDYRARIEAAKQSLPETGNALTQMLLGPVAGKLGNKRLILVLEGALQYVPFAALPSPVAPESALLETNGIVVEPSFSALIAIRKNIAKHSISSGKVIAVIADPVSDPSDDRVPGAVVSTDKAQPSEARMRDATLARLAHASEEADAISAAAPRGTTMVAKGFDANRETAMSANIGQYQIVHFATHGILDSEHPELSGIVLTSVDRNGRKTDGLMSLHDIYSLDLSAELTVLSACQTALGKDIRGEGLVGLSHAFMSAGSKSVVSSLWKVEDRATATLMRQFYESMLQQGMSPAQALRAAQLKMMHDTRTNAPYYWAGFVIQGEYTNRITIEPRSSFRVASVLLVLLSLVTAGVVGLQKRRRRISPTQSTGTDNNA